MSCPVSSFRALSLVALGRPQFVLVIGDLHVPFRSHSIPSAFREMLVRAGLCATVCSICSVCSRGFMAPPQETGRIKHVICTGNLCSKPMKDYLARIASESAVFVKGDFDEVRYQHAISRKSSCCALLCAWNECLAMRCVYAPRLVLLTLLLHELEARNHFPVCSPLLVCNLSGLFAER